MMARFGHGVASQNKDFEMSRIAESAYGDTPAPYSKSPGFKDRTTSREAARRMFPRADNLRERVMAELAAAPAGLTADEIAARLQATVLAVRPRVTELKEQGRIERTTDRRKNASGMNAWVLRIRRAP